MSVQMLIRIDPELKEKIQKLARYEGKTTSGMVREIIADYVKERDIGTYVDNLWERIGKKLLSKGKKKGDIKRDITKARKSE